MTELRSMHSENFSKLFLAIAKALSACLHSRAKKL